MRRRLPCLLILAALTLAGCGPSDNASVPIQGSDHSLTLIREKPYLWSDGWELSLVVTRMPDCMRRHHLKKAGDGKFKTDLFRTDQGGWIVRQGKKWYVAETQNCQLQKFESQPPEPGVLVGSFIEKEGKLQFVQSPDLKIPERESGQ